MDSGGCTSFRSLQRIGCGTEILRSEPRLAALRCLQATLRPCTSFLQDVAREVPQACGVPPSPALGKGKGVQHVGRYRRDRRPTGVDRPRKRC